MSLLTKTMSKLIAPFEKVAVSGNQCKNRSHRKFHSEIPVTELRQLKN